MATEEQITKTMCETEKHIELVGKYLRSCARSLEIKGCQHDRSKKEEPELSLFAEKTDELKQLTYGSDQYKQCLRDLQPALDHHYADENNRHHPEHFPNGIDDMTILDVIEMYCDWLAATKRHADGNMMRSIDHNEERFKMSPQLAQIFKNTYIRYGPNS